ncbi:helix-turn-helix domain-containing protein [Kocuria sabuli]|uniref:helix-turn-helix domain-containing protein n=1 Tax=Kocuria sabuli TaxID=3071448 RepID=UPI0034D49DF8
MTPGARPAAEDPEERTPAPQRAGTPEEEPAGGLERSIGAQVKRFRAVLGLTAKDLAERTGLSRAMISKVESASTSCSLGTLERLADGLGVPVTALFGALEEDRELALTRAGEGVVLARGSTPRGHVHTALGVLRDRTDTLEPTLVTITRTARTAPLVRHPGTEFVHLLEGEMVYRHGTRDHPLLPGDSLLFEAEAPHGPTELVVLPVRFLVVAHRHPPTRVRAERPG